QQIGEAALGHFHSDDNVAPVHQDIVNLNEAGMFQLADGLNGLDLTRRGHVVPAGNEFEGQEAALGLLPLPDLGEAAFAQRLAEFAPRIRLHAYLQRQGLTHDTRSPSTPYMAPSTAFH